MATVRVDIDQHAADVLGARAAELGVTVPQLFAELAALDGNAREARADEIAELDSRFQGHASKASATGTRRHPPRHAIHQFGPDPDGLIPA